MMNQNFCNGRIIGQTIYYDCLFWFHLNFAIHGFQKEDMFFFYLKEHQSVQFKIIFIHFSFNIISTCNFIFYYFYFLKDNRIQRFTEITPFLASRYIRRSMVINPLGNDSPVRM